MKKYKFNLKKNLLHETLIYKYDIKYAHLIDIILFVYTIESMFGIVFDKIYDRC